MNKEVANISIAPTVAPYVLMVKKYIREFYYMRVGDNEAINYALGIWMKSGKSIEIDIPRVTGMKNKIVLVLPEIKVELARYAAETTHSMTALATGIVITVGSAVRRYSDLYRSEFGN